MERTCSEIIIHCPSSAHNLRKASLVESVRYLSSFMSNNLNFTKRKGSSFKIHICFKWMRLWPFYWLFVFYFQCCVIHRRSLSELKPKHCQMLCDGGGGGGVEEEGGGRYNLNHSIVDNITLQLPSACISPSLKLYGHLIKANYLLLSWVISRCLIEPLASASEKDDSGSCLSMPFTSNPDEMD